MAEYILLGLYSVEVLGFFAMGVLVSLQPRAQVYRLFTVFAYLLGTWQALQLMAQVLAHYHWLARVLLQASVATSPLVAAAFYSFSHAYVGRPIRLKTRVTLAGGALVAPLAFLSEGLRTVSINRSGIGIPRLDAAYAILLIYAALCIAGGVWVVFWRYARSKSTLEKRQDAVIVFTSLFTGATVILASFSNNHHASGAFAEHVVPVACIITLASFLYAMLYFKLFDIRTIAWRALGYLILFTVLGLVYIITLTFFATHIFDTYVGSSIVLFNAIFTSVIALALPYLKRRFDKLTNRFFFRDAYDAQELYSQLNKMLVSSLDIDYLMSRSIKIIGSSLKAEHVLINLRGTPSSRLFASQDVGYSPADIKQIERLASSLTQRVIIGDYLDEVKYGRLKQAMQASDIAVIVFLIHERQEDHNQLGYLVLGSKKSGGAYTEQDARVLETVANELIIAIQNALHFEEIEKFNTTLQEKIDDATHQLRRTNDKLKALDETKDEFITMASHQLRTPLTSVKGYLSMVLEGDAGKLSKQQHQLLTQSYASAQRMVYLISDLLNLSRLNTGKFVIEPTPVDLREIVQSEIEQLRETAKSRELTLLYNQPASFPKLMLDETKIHQVVMNLIDNAIYYTPAGGTIEVSLVETPTAVEYRVKDNGIGVPRDSQRHLFTKFYRAQNAQAARPDGTGLGLFMAKKVVATQGGAVIFESEENKGSTFGFRFTKAHHLAPGGKTKASLSS